MLDSATDEIGTRGTANGTPLVAGNLCWLHAFFAGTGLALLLCQGCPRGCQAALLLNERPKVFECRTLSK